MVTPMPPVARPAAGDSARSSCASLESVAELTFKGDQRRAEQFPPGHDDNIEPRRELVATEELPNHTLGSVAFNRTAKLFRGGDSQATFGKSIGQTEQGEFPGVDLDALIVDTLVLGSASNPLVATKSCHNDQPEHPASAGIFEPSPLFAADRQTLATFRATALEHQTPILGRHTDKKPVRLTATPGIRLKRAHTLGHDLSAARPRRTRADTQGRSL